MTDAEFEARREQLNEEWKTLSEVFWAENSTLKYHAMRPEHREKRNGVEVVGAPEMVEYFKHIAVDCHFAMPAGFIEFIEQYDADLSADDWSGTFDYTGTDERRKARHDYMLKHEMATPEDVERWNAMTERKRAEFKAFIESEKA